MKHYDGKKIKEYIRTHSDGLVAVEIGMDEVNEACRRYPYCHCGSKMDLEV